MKFMKFNKVMPMPMTPNVEMSMTMSTWMDIAEKLLDKASSNNMHVHGQVGRCVGIASIPVACCPCFTWSAICRLLACPFQTMQHGPQHMCLSNGCSDGSDYVIRNYVYDIYETIQLPEMPDDEDAKATLRLPGNPDRMWNILHRIHLQVIAAMLWRIPNDVHRMYLACDGFVRPVFHRYVTPSEVSDCINAMKREMMDLKAKVC